MTKKKEARSLRCPSVADFKQMWLESLCEKELLMMLRQLTEKVEDTVIAAGSEVQTYAKTAAKRTPGLKGIVEQLGEAFKSARPPGEEPETADEESGSV
ncbi:MAG: hypothetical protein HC919_13815 [Oscillatoriales cyanobacterium SM2_2_1]|nr:hypothetical protein [Oscillatoriales cyanobacterium SM2_2_1]